MKRVFALSAVCVALTACDNPEGSSGSSNISNRSYVQINASNANDLSAAAMQGASGADGAGEAGVSADMAAQKSALALATSMTELYSSDVYALADDGSDFTMAGDEQVLICDDGGSISLKGGSSWLQMTFNNCSEDGELTNGAMRMDLYSDTYEFTDLKFTFMDLTVSANGNVTLSSNYLDSRGTSTEDSELSDLTITVVDDGNSASHTLGMDYSIGSDEIGGRMDISTLELFTFDTYQGVENIVSGRMRVNGADGSYIEIDADTGDTYTAFLTVSDGVTVTTETVDWGALGNSDLSGIGK